jgi:hypothetical protein
VFLGIGEESQEYIVGTPTESLKFRTIRYKAPEDARWNLENSKAISGTPWEPILGQGGHALKSKITIPQALLHTARKREIPDDEDEIQSYRMRITKMDLDRYGYEQSAKDAARLE